jgi:hypothetical protein
VQETKFYTHISYKLTVTYEFNLRQQASRQAGRQAGCKAVPIKRNTYVVLQKEKIKEAP